jgi:translation initiation factor RLI1
MSKKDADNQGAHGGVTPGHYYGHGLPYLSIDKYPGKIIALEGTDGVGRSTQIRLLRGGSDPGIRRHRDGVDAITADVADD